MSVRITLKPLKKLPLVILIVWAWELIIMLIMDSFPKMPNFVEAILDASFLIILSAYPIWKWLVKPLLSHSERKADLFERAISEFAAIGITDVNGIITYANDKFCEFSKYSRKELIGKNNRILKSGVQDNEFYKNMWATITSGKAWRGQMCNRAKDGTLYWVDVLILPIFDDDGKVEGYYAIRHNITQLKELVEKEKQLSLKVVQSVKMTSLGEMAGGIAHESNNPLGIISGKTQLIQRMIDSHDIVPEKIDIHVKAINKTVDRISGIVQGLRSFSSDEDEDTPLKPTPIKKVIDDTLNLCQARFSNNSVKLITSDIRPDLMVECRSTQISQVILNLLNNAFDAILDQQDKWISIDVNELGNDIEIRITDSGSGISDDLRNKIMQPFFTTKPVGKGVGLGLSVSLGILRSHKGSLIIDSESKNTCFVLRFPKIHFKSEAHS